MVISEKSAGLDRFPYILFGSLERLLVEAGLRSQTSNL